MTAEEKYELEYLRFFYDRVDDALGAGSWDVYSLIAEEYEDIGGVLPETYKEDDEE